MAPWMRIAKRDDNHYTVFKVSFIEEAAMKTLGKHELTERIDEILRMVEERGETFEISDHGKIVARMVPASEPQPVIKPDLIPFWEKMEQLATEIGSYLPDKKVDAVEIVREGRREF